MKIRTVRKYLWFLLAVYIKPLLMEFNQLRALCQSDSVLFGMYCT